MVLLGVVISMLLHTLTTLSVSVTIEPRKRRHLPFDQFHCNEVIAISRVVDYKAIRRSGFELKKEVHGCVGLQRGQAQIAVL